MIPMATVIATTGKVFVRNEDGDLRAVKPGDVLYESDVVVAEGNGNIELRLADGSNLSISEISEVLLTEDMLYQGLGLPNSLLPDEQYASLESSLVFANNNAIEADDVEAVLEALESGQDISEAIEPTAAGDNAQEGGHSFVRLGRIFESLPAIDLDINLPATAALDVVNPAAGEGVGAGVQQQVSLTLSATPIVVEGEVIAYTATLDRPATNDVTITLDDGSTITIPAGSLSSSIEETAPSDAIVGEQRINRDITQITSEGSTNAAINSGSVSTTIIDDNVPTNLVLSSSGSAQEGGSVVFTATLDNLAPQDIQVTIDVLGGATITILAGQLSGTTTVDVGNDVYLGAPSIIASILSASENTFEAVSIDSTPLTTEVSDVNDPTVVTLSAPASVQEGQNITYVATLSNPAQTDMAINLSNGQVISILAGQVSGSIDVATIDDVYLSQATAPVSVSTTTGGNFEQVEIGSAPIQTVVIDSNDETNIILSGPAEVEPGDPIVYTATLDNPAQTGMTVTLDNGLIIVIEAGGLSGSVQTVAPDSPDDLAVAIQTADGGNFESLLVNTAPVQTVVDFEITNLVLSASPSAVEGEPIVYTVVLDEAPTTAVTVALSNGETIIIPAGELTASIEVTAADDPYAGGGSVSVTVESAIGGSFGNLVTNPTPAVTALIDDNDVTVVGLSAPDNVSENGTVTYTADVASPVLTPLIVTLSNGQTITIAEGEVTGTVDFVVPNDVYVANEALSVSIVDTNDGGGFERLEVNSTPVITEVSDTVDASTVVLTGDATALEGGSIAYTATLSAPAESDVLVGLDNGQTITIAAGDLVGSVDVPVGNDVYSGADDIVTAIASVTGGNFESLVPSGTVITTVTDAVDASTVVLTGDAAALEGGSIAYTATLSAPAESDVLVGLDNGQTITIAAGDLVGSVDVPVGNDVYSGADDIVTAIASVTGGNFESLVPSGIVTTTVTDSIDTSTLILQGSLSAANEGETVTYTATLSNNADTDMTIALSNGQTIQIAAGTNTGSVDAVLSGGDSASVFIDNAIGGNFEDLDIDTTPVITTINDLPPTISVTANDVTEQSVTVGDVIATFSANDPGGDALSYQILNDPNNYFAIVGNDIQLTAAGVAAINDDGLDIASLDITVEATADGVVVSATDTSLVNRVDEAPNTLPDGYASTEGGVLDVAAVAGVLANDADPEGMPLTAAVFATDNSGLNEASADGVNAISTLLGGTVTLNPDGSFSYVAPQTLIHGIDNILVDSFVYRSSDGETISEWTEVAIDIADTQPVAVDDTDSVGYGETIVGNVITGFSGTGNGEDNLGADLTQLVSIEYGGIARSDFDVNGELAITTDNGVVTFLRDGSYTYVSTQSLADVSVGGGDESSWSGVGLSAFNAGTPYLNADGSLNIAASDGVVGYRENLGLYVDTPGGSDRELQLDQRDGLAEAIVIDLQQNAANATVLLASVENNDNGIWQAYDEASNLVASGTVANGANTVNIDPGIAFRYIVMTADDNNDDYNINSVTFSPIILDVQDELIYTIEDADGDQSSALLTIDTDVFPEAAADTNIAYESLLVNGSGGGERSPLSVGNVIDNDFGINSLTEITAVEYDGVEYTPVAGLITIASDQGSLLVYTQDDNGNDIRAGDYVYTLTSNNLLGDASNETFSYTLNDGVSTTTADLTINIIDDEPIGGDIESTLRAADAVQTYNLVIVLDRSGSMGNDVNENPPTAASPSRLDIARSAIEELLTAYDGVGNVNVQVIDFATTVASSQWYVDDVRGTQQYLSNLSANGATRYSSALDELMAEFNPPPATANLVYFVSDGDPTAGYLVNPTQQAVWETFLSANNFEASYSVGIGDVATQSLEPISYPNRDANNDGVDDFTVLVNTGEELTQTLLATLGEGRVSGSISVLNGEGAAGVFVGADGGVIDQVVVDGVTYTYDPGVLDVLSVETELGGTLTVNFGSGNYVYALDVGQEIVGEQEVFTVTAIDNDGDSITADVIINLEYSLLIDASRDTIITNRPDGSVINIPFAVLTSNDVAPDGATISGVGNAIGGVLSATTDPLGFSVTATRFTDADFSAVATVTTEDPADSESNGVNNTIANAVDFTDRSLFGTDLSVFNGFNRQGVGAVFRGDLDSDANPSNGSDVDWLQLSLAEGESIFFDIDNPTNGVDIDMRVYDSNGVFITRIVESPEGPFSAFNAINEGVYNVSITSGNNVSGGSGSYDLLMQINTNDATYNGGQRASSFEYTLNSGSVSDMTTVDIEFATPGMTLTGTARDEILIGDVTDDTLNAGAGDDSLVGDRGIDTLLGGEGDDLLFGGADGDILTGGVGADTFAWELADVTPGSAVTDVITDFDTADRAGGGDALDLRDLLVDESDATLTNYLYVEAQGSNTLLHISTVGNFDGDQPNSTDIDQTIAFTDVDLISGFSGDQNAIIQDLISRGKLLTD